MPEAARGLSHLKTARKESGLTQAQLAMAAGTSRQTVISIERGDYAPSVFLALKLAQTLSTTVEQLFVLEES